MKNRDLDEFDSPQLLRFTGNFKRMIQSVEQAKIAICSSIANWNLDADLSGAATHLIAIPRDPFSESGSWAEVRIDAARLRQIFEEGVWKPRLLPAIRDALSRAERELRGKSISVVLLSGGSSNIRWLKPLLKRDISSQLGDAEILELNDDFQEIVARGLAIECARRYYTKGERARVTFAPSHTIAYVSGSGGRVNS